MSEQLMVLHGAPTLAGIKTGSLFTSPYQDKNKFMQTLRRWNKLFQKKVYVFYLYVFKKIVLYYIYIVNLY